MKLVVLDSQTLDFEEAKLWDEIAALGDLTLFPSTQSQDALILERCADATVVLTNKVPLQRSVIEALPALKLIVVLATGYNVIDTLAAKECGIPVCNVPDYCSHFVAQHTVSLLLALTNRTGPLNHWVQSGGWKGHSCFSWWDQPLIELQGKTLGIVGFGRIGRKVAVILRELGMRVIASSRTCRDTPDWDDFVWVETEALFEQSDVVSLHCPLTTENQGLVNQALLHRMQSGAYLINTARGGLIHEQALREALDAGVIAGAALDVLAREPMAQDCPLMGAKNCIITPHVGWASLHSCQRLLSSVKETLLAFRNGAPIHQVNAS